MFTFFEVGGPIVLSFSEHLFIFLYRISIVYIILWCLADDKSALV